MTAIPNLIYEMAVRRFRLSGEPFTNWNMNPLRRKQECEAVTRDLMRLNARMEEEYIARLYGSL